MTKRAWAGLTLVAVGILGCASETPMTIGDDPGTVAIGDLNVTMRGGRAYWTADALVVALRADDDTCGIHPPAEGDITVSITIPRVMAIAGEQPIGSSIVRNDDVDVAVTSIGPELSSRSWMLDSGIVRLDAVGEARVTGGLVATGGSEAPRVNGTFDVPLCPSL